MTDWVRNAQGVSPLPGTEWGRGKARWCESSGIERLGESKGEKHGSVRSWRCQEASKPTSLVVAWEATQFLEQG